jgi:pilus assembly protein Flp/PilA
MNALMLRIIAKLQDEEGQALAEYGLLLGLVAVVAIGALTVLGLAMADKFQAVADAIP